MKKFFVILKTFVTWFVFIAALSMIGITSDIKNKGLVLAVYFLFFAAVFGTILLIIRSKQGRVATAKKQWVWLPRITGGVLILFGLLLPALTLGRVQIPNLQPNFFLELIITIVLVGIGAYAIRLINQAPKLTSISSIMGYALLIVESCVPGLLIARFDASNDTLGVIYFAAIFVSVLCWWGFSMIKGHQHEI